MASEGGLLRVRRAGRRKDFEMLAAWREEVGHRRVVWRGGVCSAGVRLPLVWKRQAVGSCGRWSEEDGGEVEEVVVRSWVEV